MDNKRFICIHGHFYQPPRENPWLEDIELQDSAYPFHDWNERISEECYKANAASRILDEEGDIVQITNNYSKINFNFGPTLLSWMEKHQPEIYQDILDADKTSQKNFNSHGSAIAQIYNHLIMPLANQRDKYTQAYWGIKDFQLRFGRDPEGMWLPETAVDYATLEILAELGIKYTILAPHQAASIRKIGTEDPWQEVPNGGIDFKQVYLCPLPSGKTINLFFYNGPLANEVSFGDLLNNGEKFANQLLSSFSKETQKPELVHIATDGETFGHHHRFGDMALSYCLHYLGKNNLVRVTNYSEYLELNPPAYEVKIAENTSWSCVHGIERWRNDCGCQTGTNPNWHQRWRKPLRETMDWWRDQAVEIFENEGKNYFKDIWQARNDYIDIILNRDLENIKAFFNKFSHHSLDKNELTRAIKLLEMQRNAMLMYTSCGWFFDDLSGIETIQVIRYAARSIQLARELTGLDLEPEFIKRLEKAPSNLQQYQNGANIYQAFVKPAVIDLLRVGAHYAISSLFDGTQKNIYAYQILDDEMERSQNGQLKIALGRATIASEITLEEERVSFAVLHLGDHNVNGGIRQHQNEQAYQEMVREIKAAFNQANVADIIRLMDKYFQTNSYSLWHLFKDEQRQVIQKILQPNLERAEQSLTQIYNDNYNLMNFLRSLNIPIPQPLSAIIEQAINQKLKKIFSQDLIELEDLENVIREVKNWSVNIDRETLAFKISNWINTALEKIKKQPEDINQIQYVSSVLEKVNSFEIQLHPWKAQNLYFVLKQEVMPGYQEKANLKDKKAQSWLDEFKKLGRLLKIGIS